MYEIYPFEQLTFEDTEHANEVNELYKAIYEYLYNNKVTSNDFCVEIHKKVCEKLNLIYKQKNEDYGNSFHNTYMEEGLAMARVRLSDKLERFKRLSRADPKVTEESIRDTLLDLANYAIMTYMEIESFGFVKEDK